jgi:hypothetical protein
MKNAEKQLEKFLQTEPVRCKLKSDCKFISFKNNYLRKKSVRSANWFQTDLWPPECSIKSTAYGLISVCTQTPSYLWYENQLTLLASLSWFSRPRSRFLRWAGLVWLSAWGY